MSPLTEANNPSLSDPATIIVDARGGPDPYRRYLAGHLNNAAYIDLDTHLAAKVIDAAAGGRHPLPDAEAFATLLGNLGITPASHVVIYDDKSAAFSAARLWWMLRAVGHQRVQVLNGGLQAAINAGINLSTEVFLPKPARPYPLSAFAGTADLNETERAARNGDRLVIDVRETPRYLGQTEPIDLVAGHIPGAVNLPYLLSLGDDGRYLPPEVLREKYLNVLGEIPPGQVIIHCGSGVTACHTLLGMAYAGIDGSKLYVGSWSEWSRNDLPVATAGRY